MYKEIMNTNHDKGRLHKHLIVYIIAHGAKSALWHAMSLILPVILITRSGLSPMQMGTVSMIGIFLSALLTLIAAFTMRQRGADLLSLSHSSLLGSIAAGILFFVLTLMPAGSSADHLLLVLAIIVGLRAAYAFYDMGQNAMIAFVRLPSMEHMTVPALRAVAGMGAQIIMVASWSAAVSFTRSGRNASLPYILWSFVIPLLCVSSAIFLNHASSQITRRNPNLRQMCSTKHEVNSSDVITNRKPLLITLVSAFLYTWLVAGIGRFFPFQQNDSLPFGISSLTAFSTGGFLIQVLSLSPRKLNFDRYYCKLIWLSASIGLIGLLLRPDGRAGLDILIIMTTGAGVWGLNTLLWRDVSRYIGSMRGNTFAVTPAKAFALLASSGETGTAFGEWTLGYILKMYGQGSFSMEVIVAVSMIGLTLIVILNHTKN